MSRILWQEEAASAVKSIFHQHLNHFDEEFNVLLNFI